MKVSGLDVHKDTIFCAIYDGKKYGEVIEYPTFSEDIRTMGNQMRKEGVRRIAIESTGIYWIPVWNILEEMGFNLMLVNPFLIKQMPGRKSDVKDAQWIENYCIKGYYGEVWCQAKRSASYAPLAESMLKCRV